MDKSRHFWVRERRSEAAKHADLSYSEGLQRNLGVHLRAISSTNERTFASAFVPTDELDAQHHLMGRGLKVSCLTEKYSTSQRKPSPRGRLFRVRPPRPTRSLGRYDQEWPPGYGTKQ